MIFVIAIGFVLTAWKYGAIIRSHGMRAALNNLLAALAAGIFAGLVFGVSARIAMRLLALGMDAPLRLTASGSVAVIFIFSGLGIGLAVPYAALFRAGNRGHPLWYALVLTVITLQPFIRAAAQDLAASAWDVRVMVGATLVTIVLWFPYAAMLELAYSRIAPWFNNWKPFENCAAAT